LRWKERKKENGKKDRKKGEKKDRKKGEKKTSLTFCLFIRTDQPLERSLVFTHRQSVVVVFQRLLKGNFLFSRIT
jgi:hypothetical protein